MFGGRFLHYIDPQEQAFKCIENCFESSQLIVKSMEDRDYIKHLELTIEFGNPFIFQNVAEDLDPILENVLNRKFIFDNGKKENNDRLQNN
jgi:dynein heavy chain